MPATAQDLAATQRFIDYRPVATVGHVRTLSVATADGGHTKSAPIPVASQTIRIVELLRAQATTERVSEDGVTMFASHVGVAMPDADFQRKDTFTAIGELWEVLHVSRMPDWRLSLELYSRGSQ